MIRVAYLYQHDAASPAVQSGRPASILKHMTALGATVIPVFPMKARIPRVAVVKKALYRLAGRFYRGDRDPAYLIALASEFDRRTRGRDYDVAFCPGSEAVSRLRTDRPITFCADATFANMIDYYWDFSRMSSEYVRKGHQQEASALRRASVAVYPSEWAARSAVEFYGADPSRVHVIPFGANLGSTNRREQVHRWIARRQFETLRLLFVGRAWGRKGGDLVIESAQRLVARGIRVQLDIVSGAVPHGLRRMPWVVHHGLLDPCKPDTAALLADLFKAAHFVFIPSRAEAYGMTFAEASAFGVPSIGTATGGIPSAVHDGVNGRTLPLSAGAGEFADLIAGLFSRRTDYQAMCFASFDEFERRLNWRSFCARFLDLAHQCADGVAQKAGGRV